MDAAPQIPAREAPVSRGGRWLAAGLVVLGVVLLVDRTVPALGRPVTWDPAEHPLLQLKTVIGGCELTILPPPARTDDDPAPRLEIVAFLAGVDVVVPRGIRVHVDSRGFGGREQVLADESRRPADTDLTIVVLSAFASLRVKTPV
ncbi:hypothetical protein OWR29_24285 [Actinoplanes sp. Pm04-4]|uniref:Cell wall-active antibiotics response LiaF-like C-terminal domain-containing protein n=1 Tax=Paractinoplanes pyxinae TaxID=2997416 RepID=A0ABT4B3P5_9ACTN|nr:hypothetical protein [Actinoplanes pyxinae]MCY1141129.1 hypothetical protein [Actinoplanes pyxinae]